MRKKLYFGLAVALALFLLVFPASAQTNAGGRPAARGGESAGAEANYVIGPQDVLDINVWKEGELTRQVPVRPDGKISLPLLNDIQAAGLTPGQLAAQITEGLKKFITSPQVTVIVAQTNSQRVYILGEVVRPAAYPLLPGMTVLQALSSAGGFSIFANTKKIYVLRQADGKQEKFPFNYKEAIGGKHPEQNIVLKAGDQIVVP
ncbi:MAG: polysaccharide biosynthesis/export family protein [Acidobacteriia bacterium]|nr:polysaccharide biosynthesis/export family protein [Terriglobia bacterium]